GVPIVAPIQDIVLGLYYLTEERPGARGEGLTFSDPNEAILAYESGSIELGARIKARVRKEVADGETSRELVEITPGRLILNEIPPARMRCMPMFAEKPLVKKGIAEMVSLCHRHYGPERTIQLLDEAKAVGFRFATKSGVTISMTDMEVPARRSEIIN